MKISRFLLEQVFERLVQKLKDDNINEIEIDYDLYRFIPTHEWSSYADDVILEGSLYDDIINLEKLASNPAKISTYNDFDRTASVLRAISEKLAPVNWDEKGLPQS